MKKTVSIIIITLVGLLVATTIVLACIPFKQYNIVKNDPNYVVVYKNSSANSNLYESNTDEYKSIMDLYEKSLKQNILSTMFQGALGKKAELTKVDNLNISGVLDAENAGYFVEFAFDDEDKTLVWEGKDYTYKKNGRDELAKYDSIYLQVENTESFSKTTAYIVNDGKYAFKITSFARQAELNDYINKLEWPGMTK